MFHAYNRSGEDRVWALYKSKRYGNYIIGSVVLILIAETVIQAWLMTQAQRMCFVEHA